MEQYISKSALVAEIERLKNTSLEYGYNTMQRILADSGKDISLVQLQNFIDTLEVKEVDLEKEIKEEYLKRRCYGGRDNMLVILNEPQFNKIAKHFFELGINASYQLTFEDIRTIDRILDGMRNENQVFGFPEGFYNEALKRFKAQI